MVNIAGNVGADPARLENLTVRCTDFEDAVGSEGLMIKKTRDRFTFELPLQRPLAARRLPAKNAIDLPWGLTWDAPPEADLRLASDNGPGEMDDDTAPRECRGEGEEGVGIAR